MTKKFKLSLVVALVAAVAACFTAFWTLGMRKGGVLAETELDYQVVTAGGAFGGINLKSGVNGAFTFAGKVQPSAKTDNAPVISYSLQNASVAEADGFFVQIDERNNTGGNQFAQMYFQTTDGNLYRVKADGNFAVNTNGTALSGYGSGYNYTIPAKQNFTLYIPKTSVVAAAKIIPDSGATAEAINTVVPDGATVCAFHFVLRSNASAAALNPARPITVGHIGYVRLNEQTPSESTAVALTPENYSSVNDAAKTADVNFADIGSGEKIYAKYCVNANLTFIKNGTEISQLNFSRADAAITVRYLNQRGEEMKTADVKTLSFDSASGGYPYDFSDMKDFRLDYGFVFDKKNASLTGVATGGEEVVLRYRAASSMESTSAALEGDIALHFGYFIADEVKDAATLVIARNGKENIVLTVADAAYADEENETYYFEYRINAAEMTEVVTLTLHNGNGTNDSARTRSFVQYAKELLKSENESLVTLVKDTLNYGALAQIYFGKNENSLANASLSEEDKLRYDSATVGNSVKTAEGTLPEGLNLAGFSLECLAGTKMNVYFTAEEGFDATAARFTVNGKEASLKYEDGYYSLSVEGIAAAELKKEQVFVAGDATVTLNAYAYIAAQLNKTQDENLKNLVKAMFVYGESAAAYFAK